ncbi:calcium-transporting ATPase 12, plasma membrane-type-like [Papaver somniferum]|uniref:calcium-transporting ATPase 12, plasma membrane-type-like n=1 Tax=Papaver somniferum TaxID=3469 RepID=UPI000E7032BB|nr:calcium-transporting ATPase 12, plasma membrane-type-like [Papaver somniferum]
MMLPVDHDIDSTQMELIERKNASTLTERNHNGNNNISITDPADDDLPTYTALSNDGYDNHADRLADIHLDIYSDDEDCNATNIITTMNNNTNSDNQEVLPLPTRINKDTLISILKERNLVTLGDHGGFEGIAASLATNLENGISPEAEDLQLRQAEYGTNTYLLESADPSKSFFHFLFRACKDFTIILLLCCAVISLGSGLKEEGQKNGWYDVTTLLITVFILVSVTSFRNYFSFRKSQKLVNKSKLEMTNVLRQGLLQEVFVSEVLVGDLVLLRSGDWVPADGLYLNGDNLKVDDGILHHKLTISHVQNPFLYYGAKVIHGSGQMLVISVGMNTTMGEMMSKCLILLVLLLRYFQGKKDDETGYPDQISKKTAADELMKAVERFVTRPRGIFASLANVFAVLLVGLHEGLPLVVSLSLSYWNDRTSKDHQVIICESSGGTTLGSMTSFVINKATLNQMKVDVFCIGEEITGGNNVPVISPEVVEMICDGVGAAILESGALSGPMEDPLLIPWAELNLGVDMEQLKQSRSVLISSSFGSDSKKRGSLMRKNEGARETLHLHWRGSAETILEMCSEYYNIDGIKNVLDDGKRDGFRQFIKDMDNKGLLSIAFAYSTITEGAEDDGVNEKVMITELRENNLILLLLLGVKYPCCPEARKTAVDALRNAGVSIKLVSAESLAVVKPIAIEYGIFVPEKDLNAIVLEGEDFRNFTAEERREKADRITVMGSASPSDKLLLVQSLHQKGQVVAFMGTRTVELPALREADVGLFMGTNNSAMTKESCDISIPNGNFASIVKVLLIGRSNYQNIRKFLQLELTTNISGILLTFVTTVFQGDTPITPLQLFLVNLTVGTLAALAMLTEAPTQELLEMRPIIQTQPIITKSMRRNIFVQVCYQAIVLLTFQLIKDGDILGMDRKVKKAMVFNGFVLCLVFNQFNARAPEKKNVFKGITGSHWFLVSVGVPIILEVLLMEFAEKFTGFPRLNKMQWLACILFAIMSWPIDYAVKSISSFFANRSIIGVPSCLSSTGPLQSTPSTSLSQLPTPLMKV